MAKIKYDPKFVQGAVYKSWAATTKQERDQFRLYIQSLKQPNKDSVDNEN